MAASRLGLARSSDVMVALLDTPGPATVETVVGAHWAVPLSGMINLDHPAAAALRDREEPIEIPLHAIRHPRFGLYLVDTGVERAFRDRPDEAVVNGLVATVMHAERVDVEVDTAAFLARQPAPPKGVFLTHLHVDHVMGMRDVPHDVPIYTGPGEAGMRAFEHLFAAPVIDRALEGHLALREWQFARDPAGRFEGVVDVFGDGSVWALHVPGHTDGSTAYLIRTPTHPVLLTGDACHTTWGWEHGVEPGTYSHDRPESARSLAQLRALVRDYPNIEVRVGHQGFETLNAVVDSRDRTAR